ncbi:MAG: hypothetical protein V2A54_01160 [Bacteroidota bacterium]
MKSVTFFIAILLSLSASVLQAQKIPVERTLTVSLYAGKEYSFSREKIIRLIDSIESEVNMMSEIQTENGGLKYTLHFKTNEKGFATVEKNLSDYGFVSSRDLKTIVLNYADTVAIHNRLSFLFSQKQHIEKGLDGLEKMSVQYYDMWKQLTIMEEEIFKQKEKLALYYSRQKYRNQVVLELIN